MTTSGIHSGHTTNTVIRLALHSRATAGHSRSVTSTRRLGAAPQAAGGFTLLELMLVVAVISILAAVAMPVYTEYIRRGHRADARAGLMQAQLWLERAATAMGSYPTTLPGALTWSGAADKRYTIDFAQGSSATKYTLTATPTGSQVKDRCGTYTLSNTGVRGANGILQGNAGYDTSCWGK